MTQKIDTQALNARWDLRQLAGEHTALRKVSQIESAGACPKCAGRDRFHAKKDVWFCRHCAPLDDRKVSHDAIGFVMWLESLDFARACERLGAAVYQPAQVHSRQIIHVNDRAPEPEPEAWQDETWQARAQALVGDACVDLDLHAPAQAWLAARGFLPATWRRFSLGYARRKDRDLDQTFDAIAIPWLAGERGASVRAIHYRFLAHPEKRYVSLAGSKYHTLFGVQNCDGGAVLLAVEGELNAMACWQVAHGTGLDCVSFGTESGARSCAGELRQLAQRYAALVVWCDKPEIARQARATLALASQAPGAAKVDANDRLKAGTLGGFIASLRLRLQSASDVILAYQRASRLAGHDFGAVDVLTRAGSGASYSWQADQTGLYWPVA